MSQYVHSRLVWLFNTLSEVADAWMGAKRPHIYQGNPIVSQMHKLLSRRILPPSEREVEIFLKKKAEEASLAVLKNVSQGKAQFG
jgi:hypothetical protein